MLWCTDGQRDGQMDGQTGRLIDIGEAVPICQQVYADTKKRS